MKIFELGRDPEGDLQEALLRRPGLSAEGEETVRGIIADVVARGDEALLELGRKFDSPELTQVKVSPDEIEGALRNTPPAVIAAIRTAKANIEDFHRKQVRTSWFDAKPGRVLGQIILPIERVGIYVPGGTAPYPSTVLMTAVPAKVAGVPYLTICTPAQKDGRISDAILVAAQEAGVNDIFKVGGAQAIAAMAYGTSTLPRVDKIVGPGNAYVNAAKRLLYGQVGIDMLAGPSEAAILADETADPSFVAADLISQAEHDADARVLFVTTQRSLADQVLVEIKRQQAGAVRAEIIGKSIGENGVVVLVNSIDEGVGIINTFAPEHLELMVADPWSILPSIKNAGAIMLGPYSPVAIGDYVAGPSHTLPTEGCARFSSPLNVDDFLKKSSVMWFSEEALAAAADAATTIADVEGFAAHAASIMARLSRRADPGDEGAMNG